MGDTIQNLGGDSGVVRVHGTNKAIAASVDSSAVYCWAHPLTGGKQVVAESLEKPYFSRCVSSSHYQLFKFWKS